MVRCVTALGRAGLWLTAAGWFCCGMAQPRPLLNEVMSADNASFADEDGAFEDWIELVNAGDSEADLEGWGLSDDAAQPLKWTFPATLLPPGGHLLVWASGKDRRPPQATDTSPLPLVPSNSVWRYRDSGIAPDVGWRLPAYDDSAWASGEAMLGYGASEIKTALSHGADPANKFPAAFFRLVFHSPVNAQDVQGPGLLQLWADDGAIIYLNGVEVLRVRMPAGPVTHLTYASQIANGRGAWEQFDIPLDALRRGANVLAAEVHQVNATSSDLCFWLALGARRAKLHTNFKISAGNETVTLSAPDGSPADQAPTQGVMRDASFGRAAAAPGGAWLMFPYPTPGAANSATGYVGLLAPPAFTLPPGFYADPVSVGLSHDDPSAEIYYTLDGSTPTQAVTAGCFLYEGPLAIADRSATPNRLSLIPTNPPEMTNHTQYGWMAPAGQVPKVTVVRAMAFRNGWFSPRGAAGTWLIGGDAIRHTLRVVSLMSEEENFFGGPRGLFVPGDIYAALGWNGHYVGLPNANYFQRGDGWERPVMVQLFERDRTLAFSQLMGARNHGGFSRAAAQKTLRLYARGEYGDSRIDYPLFPEQSDTSYKRILLRNSGNDWSATGLRDAMMQRLFRPLARTDTQDHAPAVVYVNGEYWGVQNIREHYSRYLLARKYGVNPDALDLVKAIAGSEAMEIDEGDDADYKEVLGYVKTNDLSQAEHMAWVERRMDLENLIDHYACEIYCCNTDWPGNNLGLWRLRTAFAPHAPYGHDGRWRWLMYDTDHGFGQSSNVNTDMMTQARRSARGVCQPHFDRLLANADFRSRFLNRFADLLNTAFMPARVHRIIDETAALVESEMPRHIARWGRMGSFAAWQTRINSLKTFASGRPAPALTNLVNEFGLGGTARLTVALSNGLGHVTVNSVTIDAATPGIADPAAPYPWHGVYFRTVPITLTAQADPGFTFSHWETAEGTRTDPALVVTLTGDTICRAVFEAGVQPRVTINEVMADASPAGCILHPADGAAADWFELFNEGPAPVALGGYWLEDSQPANAWRIPEGVVVQPGGCLTVWASSTHPSGINADGSLTAPFGLGKSGDAVALLVPDRSRELDRVVFGTQSADISQGRWPNGAAGTWNGFTQPTPGLPNRNPAFSAGLLPGFAVQTVQAGAPLAVSCVTTAAVSGAVYAVAEGPDSAAINSAGLFTWTPPPEQGSGVYAFRITLMGLSGGFPVSDETTLLVAVRSFSHARVDVAAEPAGGGTVSGGGLYAVGTQITLSPEAAPLWRFARWSDGLTAPARQVTVQRDVTYTALFVYGLGVPERVSGTVSDSLPLLYWPPVANAERYVVRRAASRAGPFTVIGTPAANVFRDEAPPVGIDAVYTVSARHGESESEASQAIPVYAGGVTRKLTGSVIGTLGAYNNNPSRTREMAFDGNLATFYDAAADGGWPGLDLGVERWWRLTRLLYAPRADFPGRMVNGAFEATHLSDGVATFETPLVLHTVASAPPINQYTAVPLAQDLNVRFVRYRPPPGGWGNIAELEVYGHETVPPAPAGLSAEAEGTDTVSLTWSGVSRCQGYLVMRAQGPNASFEPFAYGEATSLLDTGLAAGTGYRYCVAAVNGSSLSAASLPATATTALPPPAVLRFAAPQSGAAVTVGDGEAALYLSGPLDPRLELVCSSDLSTPVEMWQPVAEADFAPPDPETGAVRVTVATHAPRLFFAVRLRP